MSYSKFYYDNVSANEFLNLFYELYEAHNFPEEKDYEYKKVGLFRKEKINTKIERLNKAANLKLESVLTTPPDFDRLYEFAGLVRSMEIVFLYKNHASAKVACDHDINQNRERNLLFNIDGAVIQIYLKNDYDRTKNSIKITVSRQYGKELITEFTVKNRDVEFDTADDVYLINEINKTIQFEMYTFFRNVIENYTKPFNKKLDPISTHKSDSLKCILRKMNDNTK